MTARSTAASASSTRSARGSRAAGKTAPAAKSTAARGAAQHANAENLKDQPQGTGNPAPQTAAPKTDDVALRVPHIQHSTLVSTLKASMAGFKAAINMEIAVACAVFVEAGSTSLAAKKELLGIYAECGYDAKVGGEGADYKTVNRRIGYASAFFDKQGMDEFKAVMGEARDEAAIQSLLVHIAGKFDFKTMQNVVEAAGIVSTPRKTAQGGNQTGSGDNTGTGGGNANPQGGQPQGNGGGGTTGEQTQGQSVFHTSATSTPLGVPQGAPAGSEGVQAALDEQRQQREADAANRRTQDDPSKWSRVEFMGATVLVPVDMSVSCLGDLGLKLAHAAQQMRGAVVDVATLQAEFKVQEMAH